MSFIAPVQIAPVLPPVVRPLGDPFGPPPTSSADGLGSGTGASEVASRRTPMNMNGIRQALAGAYRQAHGSNIPGKMLDILSAHVAHETARGDRMFNYNFGGIKGTGPSGLTTKYQTTEVFDGETKKLVDGFRAYRSPEEGAGDYLKLLHDRFPAAFQDAKQGDVTAFAGSLKQAGYFTADLEGYARALRGNLHAGVGGVRSIGASYPSPSGRALPTALEVARVESAMSALSTRFLSESDGGSGQ